MSGEFLSRLGIFSKPKDDSWSWKIDVDKLFKSAIINKSYKDYQTMIGLLAERYKANKNPGDREAVTEAVVKIRMAAARANNQDVVNESALKEFITPDTFPQLMTDHHFQLVCKCYKNEPLNLFTKKTTIKPEKT